MVSRYETGKAFPSGEVLFRLLGLADVDDEIVAFNEAIRDKVATGDPDAKAVEDRFFENLDLGGAFLGINPQSKLYNSPTEQVRVFMALSKQVWNIGFIDIGIIEILAFFVSAAREPKARSVFQKISTYLEVELAALGYDKRQVVDAVLRKFGKGAVVPIGNAQETERRKYQVMIRCPQTKKAVDTGWTTDRESWRRIDLNENPARREVSCPYCQGYHRWNKEDAFLKAVVQ